MLIMDPQEPVEIMVQVSVGGQEGQADVTGLAQELSTEIWRLGVDAVEPVAEPATLQEIQLVVTLSSAEFEPLLALLKS